MPKIQKYFLERMDMPCFWVKRDKDVNAAKNILAEGLRQIA